MSQSKDIKEKILLLFENVKEKGFFHLLSANFFINFFAFGSQLIVAWILTPTQIGQIKILQTYVAIAVLFANFGFESSVLKLCSETYSIKTKQLFYKSAAFFTIGTALVTYAIVYVVSNFDVVSKDVFIISWFPIFLLAILPLAFNTLNFNYLQALKKFSLLSKLQAYTKLFAFSLIIILTYFYNISGFIYAILIGYLVTSAILIRYNFNDLLVASNFKNLINKFKNHSYYSKYAFGANLISTFTRYLDIFIINFLIIDREAIGMYSFAINVILFLQIISDTVQKISIPHFSEKSSDIIKFLQVFKRYFRLYVYFGLFLLITINIAISPSIKFIFQNKYDSSIVFIHILTIRWFFYALVQFKSAAVFGLGKINYNMWGSILYLAINFSIQYLLLNYYGILGVAIGVVGSAILYYLFYSFIIFPKAIKIID
ncbi:MAG: oligosaccharide flippase family protein [Melioribacteraceae bacterium]|nr:oligosaccharide flippase family protein [Melioribacteraceae bacterium]